MIVTGGDNFLGIAPAKPADGSLNPSSRYADCLVQRGPDRGAAYVLGLGKCRLRWAAVNLVCRARVCR